MVDAQWYELEHTMCMSPEPWTKKVNIIRPCPEPYGMRDKMLHMYVCVSFMDVCTVCMYVCMYFI